MGIPGKVILILTPVGSTPKHFKDKLKVATSYTIAVLKDKLRGKALIPVEPHQPLIFYINEFAPSDSETIGSLFESFGNEKGSLSINYSITPFYG
ncbi:Ubiquitin-like protein Atg12 like protein [Aduncisulcus paluster]|uniref:Ubiquitin-like protein Atg12 like protein n=1 Tax=Aduncisulcus paluster TaxID=2918883 RepID=A0ABQ5KC38_9EUKA|nr:Ubiquitin-like protein Atg12 like protein [Aduncisulcus paluster]